MELENNRVRRNYDLEVSLDMSIEHPEGWPGGAMVIHGKLARVRIDRKGA
jgi:hypothetical protein